MNGNTMHSITKRTQNQFFSTKEQEERDKTNEIKEKDKLKHKLRNNETLLHSAEIN